ncbi:hypothetical protein [Nocardia nepalensis]|uniref:hypothetical protein n=1 Tax=Nocardia nepalensis TaxID=3375448 RepID=UPI003B6816E7
MQHIRTAVRVGAGATLLAAALASGIGTASAQISLEPMAPAAEPSPVAQTPCVNTDPSQPTFNIIACLVSLSASGSTK